MGADNSPNFISLLWLLLFVNQDIWKYPQVELRTYPEHGKATLIPKKASPGCTTNLEITLVNLLREASDEPGEKTLTPRFR